MSAGKPEGERDLIPRWREPRSRAARGELRPLSTFGRAPDLAGLRERERDWQTHGTLGHALDLLGAGIVLGSTPEVEEAARAVARDPRAPDVSRAAAERLLAAGEGRTEELALGDPTTFEVRAEVAGLRRRVRADPRNALAWTEMARRYTILGQRPQAAAAMRVATALAPEHRHVLRAAVRLAVHHGEFDRAHATVAGAGRVREDPWLLATELASAGPAGRRPRFVRLGRTILEGGGFEPEATSELASALGTLELRAGSDRRARRLIEGSLAAPAENAIAQGQWLSKRLSSLEIPDSLLEDSAEARALRHGAAMESEAALEAAWQWHSDQPFASGPGELGSYHASVAGRFEDGARIARVSLTANPKEFLLSNNLIVCLAKIDRVKEAEEVLSQIDTEALSEEQVPTYLATLGLLEFRRGESERGRAFYQRSIGRSRDPNRQTLAKINLAVEEDRAGRREDAERLVAEILGLLARTGDRELEAWSKRLPRYGGVGSVDEPHHQRPGGG